MAMKTGFSWMTFMVAVAGAAGCTSGTVQDRTGDRPHEVVRHVVLFKFKEGAAPERVREIENRFRNLKKEIPEILAFEWGTNVSPENHAEGFTHCFVLTFRDAAARDAYLPHPAHKAFGAQLGPYLDKVLVVDYVTHD